MAVKARAFGAEIPIKVKRKLEARQNAASTTVDPTKPIQGSNYKSDDSTVDDMTYDDLLSNVSTAWPTNFNSIVGS